MGRSGSTLLQRLLNVHPGLTIWGEHGAFLSGLVQSYEVASDPNVTKHLTDGYDHRHQVMGELADKAIFKPWVSAFTPQHIEASITNMIRDLFTQGLDPEIRWGFKEIRYSEVEIARLMEMFPQAHLVVLARDIRGHAQSRFFAFGYSDFDLTTDDGRKVALTRLSNTSNGWIRRYKGILEACEKFEDRFSIVAYQDLVVGSTRPAELFAELGEPPVPQSALDEVLNAVAGSSYKFNEAARENREALIELHADVDIDWDEAARLSQILGV